MGEAGLPVRRGPRREGSPGGSEGAHGGGYACGLGVEALTPPFGLRGFQSELLDCCFDCCCDTQGVGWPEWPAGELHFDKEEVVSGVLEEPLVQGGCDCPSAAVNEPSDQESAGNQGGSEGTEDICYPEHDTVVLPGEGMVTFTRKQLQGLFHLPMSQASRELGLGETAFKRLCRRLGIPAWPYRKMGSIRTVIQKVKKSVKGSCAGAVRDLERQLGVLAQNPASRISPRTKALRQYTFKIKHKEKKRARKKDRK